MCSEIWSLGGRMHFPNLPSPDEIVVRFLHLIFPQGLVLSFLVLLYALYSWYDALKRTAEAARTGAGFARDWIARITMRPPQAVTLAFVASILLLLAQASWILFSFFLGNIISAAMGVNHGLHILMLRAIVPTWSQFSSNLRLDAVSGIYVALSIAAVIRTYWRARDRTRVKNIGWLFTGPAYFYGFLGLLGGALSIFVDIFAPLVHDSAHVSSSLVAFLLGLGVVGALYALACHLLARAPIVLADMWSGRNASESIVADPQW